MPSAGKREIEDLKSDLVVIGGGGAGLAAAVTAAEKGVENIIVLETRLTPGGNSVFPDSIFAIKNGLPKRLSNDDKRNDIFRRQISYTHGKANPRIVRALLERAEDIIGWLEGKGLTFEVDNLTHSDQVHMTARVSAGKIRTGAAVIKALLKYCEDVGIEVVCQARARKLFTNEKGRLVGVIANLREREIRITAGGFIIATGGFSGNKNMLNKYFPSYRSEEINLLGLPHKGDGIQMATEIGGAVDHMMVLEMAGPDFLGPLRLEIIGKRPNTLWVNKKGERFTDETIGLVFPEGANSLCRQPGKISYTLFDETIKQTIFKESTDPRYKRLFSGEDWTAGVDKDLHLQDENGMAKISGSWDEIAKWMGVVSKVLKATINEYNEACDQGYDDAFVKDPKYLLPLRTPPYYALLCGVRLIVTHGGIMINQRMEVLNEQDYPIPGLYAAGVDTGGRDSDTYNFSLRGHSFGFSLNSGRIAGENAAKYIRGLKRL